MTKLRGTSASMLLIDEVSEWPAVQCVNCHHPKEAHLANGRCLFGSVSWQAPPEAVWIEAFDGPEKHAPPQRTKIEMRDTALRDLQRKHARRTGRR